MTTTPQAALLSEASKLSNEFQPTMHIDVLISWGNDAVAELRRLDALVAHLTADRDDTANELALRTKHNIALTNERDQLLAKLKATQEPVHAGELPAFEQWWRQRQLLTFPKDYDQSRLADWGAAYKPAAKDAWQARAALSARKPLTRQELREAFHRETRCTLGGDIHLAERVCAVVERAHGIGLEVKHG